MCGGGKKKGEGAKGPHQGPKGPLIPPQVLENWPAEGRLTFLVTYNCSFILWVILIFCEVIKETPQNWEFGPPAGGPKGSQKLTADARMNGAKCPEILVSNIINLS